MGTGCRGTDRLAARRAGPTSRSSWSTARDRRGPHLLTSALAGLLPGGHQRLGPGRHVDLLGDEHRHRPQLRRPVVLAPARGPARARRSSARSPPSMQPRGRRPRPAAGRSTGAGSSSPPGPASPGPTAASACSSPATPPPTHGASAGPRSRRPPPRSWPSRPSRLTGAARPRPRLRRRARRDRPRAPRARDRRRPQPAGAGRHRHLAHGVRRTGRPQGRHVRAALAPRTRSPRTAPRTLWRAAGFEVTGVRTQRVSADPEDPESDSVLLQQHVVRPVLGIDESPPRLRWTIDTAAPAGPRGERWGDTHFARSLAAALERCGQDVSVDSRDARHRPRASTTTSCSSCAASTWSRPTPTPSTWSGSSATPTS